MDHHPYNPGHGTRNRDLPRTHQGDPVEPHAARGDGRELSIEVRRGGEDRADHLIRRELIHLHQLLDELARRLLAKPRTPPLTQAQAESLAIVAYLQPVSRPEIARIRGVSSESAVSSLNERGLIEESGRSRFGAAIYRTSALFEKVFGLDGLDALPDPGRFDPTPEDERDLRERLLAAGEQRAEA